MRKKGAKNVLAAEREAELLAEYRRQLTSCSAIQLYGLLQSIVKSPCSRFWVSVERASAVLSRMEKGGVLPRSMTAERRRMYEEIARRVAVLREGGRGEALTVLVREVIEQPAPEYYLTASAAKKIIYRHKKRWLARHQSRK